jgi:hypothetical protein
VDSFPEEIGAGEANRAKLRQEPPASSKESGLWKFCNSNFGLFVMSTIFISLFSWTYGQWTASRRRHEEHEKTWQRLKVEVLNRERYVEKMTQRFSSREYKVIREAIYGRDSLANVNPSWILHYSPVFPEYKERSMSSLVWELESMARGKNVASLNDLRSDVYSIEEYFDHLLYSEIPRKGQKDPDEFYELPQGEGEKCRKEAINPFKVITNVDYED